MYRLNEKDYKKIKLYKKVEDDNIALYFFDKYRSDVIDIVYSKINRKFSSIPFEKGDLFHLLWKAIKSTLKNYKKEQDFSGVLITNCYYTTLREVRKFINNNQLVMNVSSSLETYQMRWWNNNDKAVTSHLELPRNVMLNNLINEACLYVEKYKTETVKKVIYLKSLGYSIREISEDLDIGRYYVEDIIDSVEKIARRLFS